MIRAGESSISPMDYKYPVDTAKSTAKSSFCRSMFVGCHIRSALCLKYRGRLVKTVKTKCQSLVQWDVISELFTEGR